MSEALERDGSGRKIIRSDVAGVVEGATPSSEMPGIVALRLRDGEALTPYSEMMERYSYDVIDALVPNDHWWATREIRPGRSGQIDLSIVRVGVVSEVQGIYRAWTFPISHVRRPAIVRIAAYYRILWHYFLNCRARRFEVHVRSDRKALARTLDLLGWVKEGTLRKYLSFGGVLIDVDIFALLGSEYLQSRGTVEDLLRRRFEHVDRDEGSD